MFGFADEIKELEGELSDAMYSLYACRRSHFRLCNGIKRALQLENWPDFYNLYGNVDFTEGVVRYLIEEVGKMRGKLT